MERKFLGEYLPESLEGRRLDRTTARPNHRMKLTKPRLPT
jgi:hypothetical protein